MKQTFLSILLMLMPMMASAASVKIGDIWYNLITKGNFAEVTQSPTGYSGSIVIPDKVTDSGGTEYTVSYICDNAFMNCTGLNSITIPSSVTAIGNSAFLMCSGLSTITIPNKVNTIGNYAFKDCIGITSITIPQSVTSIGEGAFAHSGLTSISLPTSITSISPSAFFECLSLTTVTIPNTVKDIFNNSFDGCSNLTSVTIPEGVTSISTAAFARCSSLQTISIPSTVSGFGMSAFENCSSLISINIPDNVTFLPDNLFSGCSNLVSIKIPDNVTTISTRAFAGCAALTSIVIPANVKYIGTEAFSDCSKVTDVYSQSENVDNDPALMTGVYATPDAFKDSYQEYITLHVPAASISAYQTIEPWKYFKGIVPIGNNDDTDDAYIDLGLPSGTKWATMNVGATNPGDPGDIFAWAETDVKTSFTENNYKYGTSLTDMTKYNSNDGLTVLEAGDDAATANMGADWRTPTVAEWRELRDKCTRTWMTVNGKTGYQFTGPNGNKIFLPCGFDNFWGNGAGYYWSSSLSSEYVTAAWNVDFDKGGFYIDHKEPTGFDHRYTGRNIRAVYGNTTVTPPTQKCATPTIIYSGGKLRFTCETPNVEFFYDISSADDKNGKGSEVGVTPVYHINVYASREGYLDSDVASADINMACEDSQSSPVVGDLNGDNKVDVADHVELSNIILNQQGSE